MLQYNTKEWFSKLEFTRLETGAGDDRQFLQNQFSIAQYILIGLALMAQFVGPFRVGVLPVETSCEPSNPVFGCTAALIRACH